MSMEPWPDIMTTAMSGYRLLIRSSRSMPSTSGSQTSRMARSTSFIRRNSIASSPFPAGIHDVVLVLKYGAQGLDDVYFIVNDQYFSHVIFLFVQTGSSMMNPAARPPAWTTQ